MLKVWDKTFLWNRIEAIDFHLKSKEEMEPQNYLDVFDKTKQVRTDLLASLSK